MSQGIGREERSPGVPRDILILKPSSLGDVVHTLSAAALLRRRWPDSRIFWMVNPEWAPILQSNPLDLVPWVFPRRELRGIFSPVRYLAWVRKSPCPRPDLAVDFQGLFRSALTGKLLAPARFLGLSDAREGAGLFYHEQAKVGHEHAVERYRRLAELATGESVGSAPLEFPLPNGETPPNLPARFVALHPFSRGEGKSLSVEWVNRFCTMLGDIPVVVVGRGEAGLLPPNGLNLLNQTSLTQLIGVLQAASCVVSVDSGPMHLAAATAIPLLAVHGWSDPRLVGPYRQDAQVWKGGRLQRMAEYEPMVGNQLPTLEEMNSIAEWAAKQFQN